MMKSPMTKEFLIPSDLSLVQKTSAKVLDYLKPMGLSRVMVFDIRLCLEEALINAMKYGNRLVKSRKVRLVVEHDKKSVRLAVEDQGRGFNVNDLKDCTKKTNLLRNCGRGVYLIHRLMDKVVYSEKGNCISMLKIIKPKPRNRISEKCL